MDGGWGLDVDAVTLLAMKLSDASIMLVGAGG
jgi:hypothetical protein